MKNVSLTIDVEEYGGKQVAIANDEIIAVGETAREVLDKAYESKPDTDRREIKIFAVPKTTSSIYCV